MRIGQQQSSNSTINRVVQPLQSSALKQKNLSDKVRDVEISRLIDDTVKLSRSKRSKKGKKGSSTQHVRNKWNKKNREKAREIVGEAVDYFNGYEDQLIYNRTSQGAITLGSKTAMSLEQLNLELINSVKQSNLNKVKEYINKGADISTKDNHGKTPLHIAAKRGLLDIAKFLLDKGADIDAQENKFGRAPLHLAAAKGHLDIVKYLIEKGADVDVYQGGWSYSTALHLAAQKGHLDIVKYLIEKGANPKATDGGGKTPLQRATQKGHSDIVEYLKGKVPQITERQQVATEVPQITEDYSNISLHFAAEQGNLNAVKYFVEKGADINANNWYGGTPLKLAVSNGHLDVVRYLVEKGASVDLKDSSWNAKGWVPLHFAAHKGYLDIVKCLIEKGADVNAKNNYDSSTPLHEAAQYGHLTVAEELIEKNANINAKDKYGYTPLHSAALNGHLAVVKKLIEKGADVNVKNNNGQIPLDIARSRGYSQIVEFLSSYQHESRNRRDIVSSNSWMNDSIVNWVKGFLPSTKSPDLLTSREHSSTAATAIPEINTTVVNNTLLLGILAVGLFNKTQYRQPMHESLLSPREQSMRLNNVDEKMIIRAIQKGEEKFGDPKTEMDEVKISGNKTGIWRGFF